MSSEQEDKKGGIPNILLNADCACPVSGVHCPGAVARWRRISDKARRWKKKRRRWKALGRAVGVEGDLSLAARQRREGRRHGATVQESPNRDECERDGDRRERPVAVTEGQLSIDGIGNTGVLNGELGEPVFSSCNDVDLGDPVVPVVVVSPVGGGVVEEALLSDTLPTNAEPNVVCEFIGGVGQELPVLANSPLSAVALENRVCLSAEVVPLVSVMSAPAAFGGLSLNSETLDCLVQPTNVDILGEEVSKVVDSGISTAIRNVQVVNNEFVDVPVTFMEPQGLFYNVKYNSGIDLRVQMDWLHDYSSNSDSESVSDSMDSIGDGDPRNSFNVIRDQPLVYVTSRGRPRGRGRRGR
ncbi:hypothetical protein KFK09_013183 [Dendrobium nobile]|uniref:Uncharacterized protein n=1 Tax=Dendrobium nobile TaxID=94219 RepID=A0A8T3B812_DENNO|nr:hypothetical protein KFK09_013183 [Dendrobium nobile]